LRLILEPWDWFCNSRKQYNIKVLNWLKNSVLCKTNLSKQGIETAPQKTTKYAWFLSALCISKPVCEISIRWIFLCITIVFFKANACCSIVFVVEKLQLDLPRGCVFVNYLNSSRLVFLFSFFNVRVVKRNSKFVAERIIDRWPRKAQLFWLSPEIRWEGKNSQKWLLHPA